MFITFSYFISKSEREAHFIATGDELPRYREWKVDVSQWTEEQRALVYRLYDANRRSLPNMDCLPLCITKLVPMSSPIIFATHCPTGEDDIPRAIADLLRQYDEHKVQEHAKVLAEVESQPNIKRKVKGWLGLDLD